MAVMIIFDDYNVDMIDKGHNDSDNSIYQMIMIMILISTTF
jgi:hypothetical protein